MAYQRLIPGGPALHEDGTNEYLIPGGPAVNANAAGTVAYTLNAEAGSYSITGANAGLPLNRLLIAAAGAYSMTGGDAELTYLEAVDTNWLPIARRRGRR